MFKKVLVANRGEIACRLLRTLRKLEVPSVAIYSEADRFARHVFDADEAVCVGPAQAAQSYLNQAAIVEAAIATGAEAVHPGYGFLSENTEFAAKLEQHGITFVGPTPEQIRGFGLKHLARAIAEKAGVPLLPGSAVLENQAHALAEAERIGYPVMLKSSAGGGGIGMQLCHVAPGLARAFEAVKRLGENNFGDGSVFLERFVARARHLEVQIFGDGRGNVIALGERDCSAQRRNQKVVEEAPAYGISKKTRRSLHEAAVMLGKAVAYRSAGTVEFVYDAEREEAYFLEVNTRLQVEHGVTEAVREIDLVEWMLLTAAGDPPDLDTVPPGANGHAIEVRLYAEDPARGFKPSSGLLTEVVLPANTRCDGWIERGTEVSAFYDPLLVKLIVHGSDRPEALARLESALAATRIGGIETNLSYLRDLAIDPIFTRGEITTQYLNTRPFQDHSFEVLRPGTHSTVQDYPGRTGYWSVGIPPSGAMDTLGLRLANRIVGNPDDAAALEITLSGPKLKFAVATVIALGGARMSVKLDEAEVEYWRPIAVRAGQILDIGSVLDGGCRAYLAVQGGIDVPDYLGSKSTFTLGGFGGHGGRALRSGDVLHIGKPTLETPPPALSDAAIPEYTHEWQVAVIYGPHGAPDFFTERDIEMLFSTSWEVHYNSARTGVRLIGPKPEWARADGGEAGLHPSNIHDVPYAIGAIDFTGDMPILLGPDGPSLGGFVCPATVASAELWKLGQLRPGDRVRFVACSLEAARELENTQERLIRDLALPQAHAIAMGERSASALAREIPASETTIRVAYRRSGDKSLLVEYGPPVLDLRLRFRAHALMQWVEAAKLPGILDLTPGIRSLQIHYDDCRLSHDRLLDALVTSERELPSLEDVEVPSRVVHLPLSWDDPATQLAIQKYTQLVRPDAPWAPSNIEFIRRINGLESIEDVHRIVFEASYLVLGLGDVYLGAPVATPIDPRHRLVTTKYNPARTWTPENAVGIGGAYLCVYGMEGPGGYQFVGRTVQMYNRFRVTKEFEAGTPWLLRFFDQIRFYPVRADELLEMRDAFPHGRFAPKIEESKLRLRDYERFLVENTASISTFKRGQQAAFEAERQRWIENGQLNFSSESADARAANHDSELLPNHEGVESHVSGSIWKILVVAGDRVRPGDPLFILESMKMEISVEAQSHGTITELCTAPGKAVSPGERLAVLRIET
jgi:urea carboxylase